ncbi:tyrosine decarboxylase 1-like [Gossypium australe]|uniref:Tyrosine decarboxylase 1-like n=1 Tax=Gossypium australe TaxID=47621 RepID=A0A5B6VKK3_9ROSI|nr:tyrosine decarboxylase 1-like [Gossypium australe]
MKKLWVELRSVIPTNDTHWMAIVSNLQDLGFKGPLFTQYRGGISERLDRICTKALAPNSFPKLSCNDEVFLRGAISDEEIKLAMFDMASLKAPGSNGFHFRFFKSQWELVGGAICNWVRKIFDGEPIDSDLNNTLLVLISKVQNPEGFEHFRPISLCSVLYKLVMKIIANMFKVVFQRIIG